MLQKMEETVDVSLRQKEMIMNRIKMIFLQLSQNTFTPTNARKHHPFFVVSAKEDIDSVSQAFELATLRALKGYEPEGSQL